MSSTNFNQMAIFSDESLKFFLRSSSEGISRSLTATRAAMCMAVGKCHLMIVPCSRDHLDELLFPI